MNDTAPITTATCSYCDAQVEQTRDGAMDHEYPFPGQPGGHRATVAVTQANQIGSDEDDEVIAYVMAYADTMDGPIDWEWMWERIDGMEYESGPWQGWKVDFGSEYDTPAMRKIQRVTRKLLRG